MGQRRHALRDEMQSLDRQIALRLNAQRPAPVGLSNRPVVGATPATSASLAGKTVQRRFPFRSKSNPDNSYECLLYTDGSTSCNCPGWTRQIKNGVRDCKHVQAVAGLVETGQIDGTTPAQDSRPTRAPRERAATGRRFDLDA